MKILLAHDFLNQWGGGERVLKIFYNMYSHPQIFTITWDKNKVNLFKKNKISTSFIQKLPFGINKYKWYLMLMPKAVEKFKFFNTDVVLSDCSGLIKGINIPKDTLHVCYLHTTTRYLTVDLDYFQYSVPKLLHPILPLLLKQLKKWDYQASQKPNYYIANSNTTALRLQKYYNRTADAIVFPPVETDVFYKKNTDIKKDYYLIAGRLAPYKKCDLAIKVFNKIKKPLYVIGTGVDEDNLKKIAEKNICFKGSVSDEQLRKYYSEAKAVIFPPLEDAGMVPLEAMACGTPVIAYGKGGARESIEENKTGIFFDNQTEEDLLKAIQKFEKTKFDSDYIIKYSQKFSSEKFQKKISDFVKEKYILFSKKN